MGDAAKDVLDLARARFRVNGGNGSNSAQRPIGSFQPTGRALLAAQALARQRDDAREPIKPVRLKPRQPPRAPPALQAARRKIQGIRQLFERQS